MEATAVLERLTGLGVKVTPTPRGTLWLEPASLIPPDLLGMVRQHKALILRRLAARDRLLGRLRAGIEWLTTSHNALCTMEDGGERGEGYERLRVRFLNALHGWDCLDFTLRFVYEHQGCVMAEGRCPDDAPVTCRGCVR